MDDGNPMTELSTAAGLGAAALNFIHDDEGLTERLHQYLEAHSCTTFEASLFCRTVECSALACAGLSHMLASSEQQAAS